jgi:molybdopterin-guanine dinucleotide biosynthesis protein A
MNNLLGVVLCGGESRRMGRDKGLLEKDAVPWAVRMGGKLAPWRLPVVYSIHDRQQAAYAAILSPELLIVDALELPGPLNGLFSVHRRYPNRDLLLLACDMQDLDEITIRGLIGAYRGGGYEYYGYQAGPGFFQPFCAIYMGVALAEVCRSIMGSQSPGLSLQSLLKKGNTKILMIDRMEAFANYNFPGGG